MIIARRKRKENIAEYLLYMWQVEDLIRANNFDMDSIRRTVVDRYDQPDDIKEEIAFDGDPVVKQLAQEVREDITAMPYDQHVVVEKEGKTYLQTRYGDFPVYIPDRFFLINLNAARLACRQLGVKDADFYQALSEYSVSLQP